MMLSREWRRQQGDRFQAQKVKCVGEKNIEEKRVCMQCGVSELVHIITGLIIPHLIYGVTVYKAIFEKENLKW